MSGLSNRSLGTSSSSSSEGRPRPVSLSPPSASSLALVARRSSAMSSMSASSILLSTQRSNSRLATSDEELDPVTRAASKLNEIMEQGGIFFSCGSPRASGGQDELLLIDEIAEGLRFGRRSSLFGGSTTTDNGRQGSNTSSSSSSSDSQDNDDNGIELDSETSLRPAYELYRV